MKSTRVRGELGPACATCKRTKKWSGTRWFCHPCRAAKQRSRRASVTTEQRELERVRDNEARNLRRAAWPDEKRDAVNAYTAEWRESNRDRHRQVTRSWYAAHADRARAAKSDSYYADKSAFLARNLLRKARHKAAVCEHGESCVSPEYLAERIYSQACVYCGANATDADHFTPLSRGGLHCQSNLVPACGPCNGSKHARDPIEFIVGVRGDQ